MSELTIKIPYLSTVSKNHCFIAGDRRRGYVRDVRDWCEAMGWIIRADINLRMLEFKPPIVLDICCYFPKQRGRRPDAANFRAVIQDVVAKVVGIDDSHFSGTDTGVWGIAPRKACFEITIRG
ncbi:MAG: hypothetical protein ABIG63_12860 [Chloroflexota bacterium]